jgi:hypothetical protein
LRVAFVRFAGFAGFAGFAVPRYAMWREGASAAANDLSDWGRGLATPSVDFVEMNKGKAQ